MPLFNEVDNLRACCALTGQLWTQRAAKPNFDFSWISRSQEVNPANCLQSLVIGKLPSREGQAGQVTDNPVSQVPPRRGRPTD
jgi:hypothetical protein